MSHSLSAARLYGILDAGYTSPEAMPHAARELLAGGVGILQLRAKSLAPADIEPLAAALLPLAREAGVPFIVNDHADIAARIGADGVHVGQDDGALAAAREILGPGAIVGRSTHSLAQAEAAQAEGADYIGFGPLFPTPTKAGRPAIGLGDIAEVHRRVTLPIFCIGGIKPENLAQVRAAGARRVVVVSALLTAPDRSAMARSILRALA